MVTPLEPGGHPHFTLPAAQGWALKRLADTLKWLGQAEAKRMWYRRQRDGLDPGRLRDVRTALSGLLAEVSVGSKLLYDGLPASSLDGQLLDTAIVAHLARPTIPAVRELLHGLCTAAGLCLERAGCTLCKQVEALRGQAAAVQAAAVRSQGFWRVMLGRLPEGCCRPLSSSCCW